MPADYVGEFGRGLQTPSGKFEFVAQTLKNIDDVERPPLNSYMPTYEDPRRDARLADFPLQLLSPHSRYPFHIMGDERGCTCSYHRLDQYRAKLSGPLMDRFDIEITMARPTREELLGPPEGESSQTIRARVEQARQLQAARYNAPTAHYQAPGTTNASVPKAVLDKTASLSAPAAATLGAAVDTLRLSGRAVAGVVRVARTIADLAQRDAIIPEDIEEALSLRSRTKEPVAA